jgi:hypothetical protein
MNKTAKTIGIIGGLMLLVGGIFKVMHYPGASMLLIFGLVPALIFLFAWMSSALKEANSSKEKTALITIAIAIAIMCVSAIFKIMHWPGANITLMFHAAFLLLVVTPVVLMYLKTESNETKRNGRVAFYIFYVGITGIILAKGGLSGNIVGSISYMDSKFEAQKANYDLKNKHLYETISDSSNAEKLEKLKMLSANLQKYVSDLKLHLVSEVSGLSKEVADTININYIDKLDNYDIPTHILIGDDGDSNLKKGPNTANDLKLKIEQYRAAILDLVSADKKELLNKTIGLNTESTNKGSIVYDSTTYSWETNNFYHVPLFTIIPTLSELQSGISYAEGEILSSLK